MADLQEQLALQKVLLYLLCVTAAAWIETGKEIFVGS
jgi:hypothetical protein